MTEDQIGLVRDSFAKVAPIAPAAASMFYGRLFTLDPSLKSLFTGDMEEQGEKLMMIIATVVGSLDRFEQIAPTVRELGRRHAGYGVKAAHFDTVAAALLWALEQGLGDGFTPAVRDGWVACYGVLSKEMKEAAASA